MNGCLRKSIRRGVLGTAVSLMAVSAALAQDSGTINGVISSGADGSQLAGAVISLEGTSHRATAGSDGRYRFAGVEPGTYTIKVSYIGFEDYTAQVTVTPSGGVVLHTISMAPELGFEEVVVTGMRLGQTKELMAQKNAANIKNMISEEQINSFPDLNTAEVLQRVSGVGIQRDNGEGRFITMRGTARQLTNVTVNGEQVAFSNAEARTVELDVISAAQLAGVEVTKVLTPDMDANAIGGSVNLKTRSAFDQKERVLNMTAGVGRNSIADKTNSRFAVNFADVFGEDENIGFSVGVNFARTARERHNSEHEWVPGDDLEDTDGNELPADQWFLGDSRSQFSENTRDRLGVNARLEYRFDDNHEIFFSGMYNYREDDQERQEFRLRIDRGEYDPATDSVYGARVVNGLNFRLEKQKITSFSVGSEHRLGESSLDLLLATSSAYTKKPQGQLKPEWQFRDVDAQLSALDTMTPMWALSDRSGWDDRGIDVIDLKYEDTTSTINTAQANFETPITFGSDSGTIKFGGKYREVEKSRQDVRSQWEGPGSDSDFYIDGTDVILSDGYNIGPRIDGKAFQDWFFANQGGDVELKEDRADVNLGEPYSSVEKVKSLYAMTTQEYGALTVLAGLRAEFTSTDAVANHLVLGEVDWEDTVLDDDDTYLLQGVQENVLVSRNYDYIFPNLQFKYAVSDRSNVRLAYSRGIAPPDFWSSMPFTITAIGGDVELEDGTVVDSDVEVEILAGNPYLRPAKADNLDFLAEYYFEGIGILSGGVFFKKLKDFNFTYKAEIASYDDPFDLIDPAFDVTKVEIQSRLNGGGADLFGVELTWQQQFTFLKGWMSGFGVYANYTYTNASNIDLGEGTDRTDIAALPEQMKHIANLALTYERGGLTSRLSWNYSGKYIEEVGGSADQDIWRDNAKTLDFSASYKFMNGLGVFFQANNLTNEVKYNYFGIPTRSDQHSITGRSFDLGLKYSF